VTAQPDYEQARQVDVHDPDDIVSRLPEKYREPFLHEYRAALDAAHDTWRYRELRRVLNLWHLRALMYADPGHEQARREAAQGVHCVPAEQVIPGWADLVAARSANQGE
jgi:hypothetical protein